MFYHQLQKHLKSSSPELPSRRAYKDRFALYYNLNAILKAYREEQEWSSAELCAFLYDFAPKFVGGTN